MNQLPSPPCNVLGCHVFIRTHTYSNGGNQLTDINDDIDFPPHHVTMLRRVSSKRLQLVKTASKKSLRRLGSRLGLQRKSLSSYPDLFEGDISNSVCKKSLFPAQSSSSATDQAECLTLKIDSKRNEPQNQECSSSHGMAKQQQKENTKGESLSQKILSSWFFTRKTSTNLEDEDKGEKVKNTSETTTIDPNMATNSRRFGNSVSVESADSQMSSSTEDNGEKTREKKISLTKLISKQFSAATDFRQLNYSVPQSM